jgi:hypothetical protein
MLNYGEFISMKATLSDGTVLEGQTSEIVEAIRELGQRVAQVPSTRLNGASSGSAGTAVWSEDKVRNLWNFLYGKQKDLVRFLIQRGGKASIQEVMKELSLHKSTEVAGLRSCITRNSRRETGYKKAELIAWERNLKGEWNYKIAPDALVHLKKFT